MTAKMQRPAGRSPGESWQDILARSKVRAPDFLWEDSHRNLDNAPLAADRYTGDKFFRAECERMWPSVWQFAARDEELQNPGDFVVYENAGRSYLVVRQQDDSVKAFHNVCLHRGRKLRTEGGAANEFQCPFHGFSWHLDGTLKDIPCRWDFPHLKDDVMTLPEASVASWQGYIFVRENTEGPSLEEYLHPLPDHFSEWRNDQCSTAMWVGKVIDANWKTVAEAFMEAWHSLVTHPQFLWFLGDANTKYDIYGDHVNRALTPAGVLSPHLEGQGYSEQDVAEYFLKYNGRNTAAQEFTVPPGQSARVALAEYYRQVFGEEHRRDYSQVSDGELLDALVYNVFPNFSPWGGFMPTICYRWRPWPDQNRTLMEVRILVRVPEGEPTPPAPAMHMLGPDEPWSSFTAWGFLGEVFDQDMANLPFVHEGLKASKNNQVQLGNYQEMRIRQFHHTLDKYLDK